MGNNENTTIELPEAAGKKEAAEKVTRLNRFWWWTLVVYSAAALVLSINDIFQLRIFGFMPIASGHYYYLIALYAPLVYILYPATSSAPSNKVPWYDCLLFLVCLVIGLFFGINSVNILTQGWDMNAPLIPTIFGVILWGLMLEGCRRTTGWVLTIVCGLFSIYPLFAGYLPGILGGITLNFHTIASYHALSQGSIIGIPMRTMADLIIGFMIFGIALDYTGAGKFFINVSSRCPC